jgi:squalene synthase HpnC
MSATSGTLGRTRDPEALVRAAVRRHDENFPLAFPFLDRARRADMAAVYAFCRATDDIGDEGALGPGERIVALDAWEEAVRAAFAGRPDDPLLAPLARAARRRSLELEPFLRLIEANRMDQRRDRWDTFESLRVYCTHSATPVGHMVLQVLGYRDRWRQNMSDAVCMGLQLVNFWQDIARDLADRGRVYLPQEDMAAFGVTEEDLRLPRARPELRRLVAFEVGRARQLLEQGAPLAHFLPRAAAFDVTAFTLGGLALCRAIADQGYDTLRRRPRPGRIGRARIAAAAGRSLLRGR